jgi:hypothetical protein
MNSLPPEDRTIVTHDEAGIHIEAIPGMIVCDFCTATPVVVAYPCGPVSLGPSITTDPWTACATCHALIEADDRGALTARAVCAGDRQGFPPELAPMFAELHARFFAARIGDAQPVPPGV